MDSVSVLNGKGEVFSTVSGEFGDLFPQGTGIARGNPVVALDIQRTDGTQERLLVPATQGPAVESSPYLVVEHASSTVFLVWESRRQFTSRIHLTSFSEDGGWGETIELSGDFFSQKSLPRIAVTRDELDREDADGEMVTVPRTIIHTAWWEEAGEGNRAVYSPLVFHGDDFLWPNTVYILDSFDVGEPSLAPVATNLATAPTVQAGRNARSATVGFVNPTSGNFVTLEVGVVPEAIGELADTIYDDIKSSPGGSNQLAQHARVSIIDIGLARRLHPDVTSYLGDRIHDLLLESNPTEPGTLADRARASIIDVGSRITVRDTAEFNAGDATSIIEVPAPDGIRETIILARVASSRPSPRVEEGELFVFLSPSGGEALVAWEAESEVRYIESADQGWTDHQALMLSSSLDREDALRLLEIRTRNR